MKKRHLLRGLCAATLAVASLGLAQAQSYPSKPVRLIVPFPAGGATDLFARTLSQKISEKLGQSLVVENRPGAGGTLGSDLAAKANPDGYTLLLSTSSTHSIGPNLNPRMPYDAVRDFEPVARYGQTAVVLVVAANSPLRSVRDVIEAAKQKPEQLSYASAASTSTMAAALMENMTGTKLRMIPYKSSPQTVVDVAANIVDLTFAGIAASMPLIQSGRVRALAVTSATRSPLYPDTPTMKEGGYPELEAGAWYGVFAPAGSWVRKE